ncbi:Purple acid phosphatase [Caenorhabditis elegans]|uniref:Purple acid phosphatase n=1 Tax=Caenorhabditis elegans TaxID=6239 RepID=Q9NAM9_CAEEL|nr:Purple acid phosphatase [Caenorhabditis elegans]CAB54350.3 Purple acid phosphatase [Caenorhabditis elegans]|eukprot:NP_502892.3 Purple acid phosphatase [Caenorhabditis elegans]
MILWFSLVFVLFFKASDGKAVEQVHLSLSGNPNEMVVTWLTQNPLPNVTLYALFGVSQDSLRFTAKGNTTGWADQGKHKTMRYTHRATMQNLVPGQVYYYQVGSSQAMSSIFHFRQPDPSQPLRAAIFGDLSIIKGQQSIDQLIEATKQNQLDVIIHIGDLAYDLHDENGATGDDYMNAIEPFAAYVPYMVFAGNHEVDGDFNHIKNRFTMPRNGVYDNNLFWSFTYGFVHIIAINSEYYAEEMSNEAKAQYQWLREDLAQNTKKWTIVMFHRPWYCSSKKKKGCNDDQDILSREGDKKKFPGLEELLNQYKVDMVLYGHKHTYERMWPIYNKNPFKSANPGHIKNAPAPVYILTGGAGCHSHEDPSDHIMQDFSVKALGEYGYTYLTVYNSTHISTDYVDTSSTTGKFLDPFVLEKL